MKINENWPKSRKISLNLMKTYQKSKKSHGHTKTAQPPTVCNKIIFNILYQWGYTGKYIKNNKLYYTNESKQE